VARAFVQLAFMVRQVTPEAVQAGLDFHNKFGDEALAAVRAKGIPVTEPAIGPFRDFAPLLGHHPEGCRPERPQARR
jgi:hypothetical protein